MEIKIPYHIRMAVKAAIDDPTPIVGRRQMFIDGPENHSHWQARAAIQVITDYLKEEGDG